MPKSHSSPGITPHRALEYASYWEPNSLFNIFSSAFTRFRMKSTVTDAANTYATPNPTLPATSFEIPNACDNHGMILGTMVSFTKGCVKNHHTPA